MGEKFKMQKAKFKKRGFHNFAFLYLIFEFKI